jgi:hypothetical protein
MALLLSLPLWIVADLRQPLGTGDKRLLREVARKLGVQGAAALPKRAIQVWSAFTVVWSALTLGASKLVVCWRGLVGTTAFLRVWVFYFSCLAPVVQ